MAADAYRAGNSELGDRIARVMNGGLTDEETLAEREVVLAFVPIMARHAPELQGAIIAWPTELKGKLGSSRRGWRDDAGVGDTRCTTCASGTCG